MYNYQPLQDGHIRVVSINRADNLDSPLRCSIHHRPIRWTGEFDPYMTLSYSWGQSFDDGSHLTKELFCDGRAIPITANVDLALRYIRLKLDEQLLTNYLFAEPREDARAPIWIDAV